MNTSFTEIKICFDDCLRFHRHDTWSTASIHSRRYVFPTKITDKYQLYTLLRLVLRDKLVNPFTSGSICQRIKSKCLRRARACTSTRLGEGGWVIHWPVSGCTMWEKPDGKGGGVKPNLAWYFSCTDTSEFFEFFWVETKYCHGIVWRDGVECRAVHRSGGVSARRQVQYDGIITRLGPWFAARTPLSPRSEAVRIVFRDGVGMVIRTQRYDWADIRSHNRLRGNSYEYVRVIHLKDLWEPRKWREILFVPLLQSCSYVQPDW